MKKIYIIYSLLALGLLSCSKESPFDNGENQQGEGQLSTSAISLQLDVDETIRVRSRAGNEDLLPDFDLVIADASGNVVSNFKYRELPEIITLRQGNYKIKAEYGEDKPADWNNPYFAGEGQFSIKANEITKDIDPVICYLKNVMVSIKFDEELLNAITGSPKVDVNVNNMGTLTYTIEHSKNGTPGYYKHDDVQTLVATFTGIVDGVQLKETKTLDNIKPGNHYRLNFYKHIYQGDESGYVEGGVQVDARVTVNNLSENVDLEEETILEDVTWPSENEEKDPDPSDPTEPSTDGPTIELDPQSTVEFDKVNDVTSEDIVIMKIHSNTGLTKFVVDIVSENLHLSDIGADSDSLDLIEPGKMLEALHVLHLIDEDKESLRGETDVDFDISGLMDMLVGVNGEHKFIVNVGDSEGENTKELILNVP